MKRYWPVLFVGGYLVSLAIDFSGLAVHMNSIEIHWRLFLILGLSALSLGGFLLTLLPPWMGFMVCTVVIGLRLKHLFR